MALIHQWKLTTNATDSVGGLVTANNGGVTFSPTNGASFNGTNQWLSFTKSLVSTNPLSISIWLKFANVTQITYPFTSNSGGANVTGFKYDTGYAEAYYGSKYSINNTEFTSSNYPNTSFVLCTMTYDGVNTLKIYRGATLLSSATISGQLTPDANWSIGRPGSYNGQYLNGNALDARMYSHALSPSEITALYSAGAGGGTSTQRPQAIGGF